MARNQARRSTQITSTGDGSVGCLLLRALLSLLLVTQGVAGFLPGPLLWGFSHLAYAPPWVRVLWPAIGILIIWAPPGAPLSRTIGRLLANRCAKLILGRRFIAYAVLPVLGASVFWLVRCKTHFLGDGWMDAESVSRGLRFHDFDLLTYNLVAGLFATVRERSLPEAFTMFARVATVSGALYLIAAAWSARTLSKEPHGRIWLFGLLVFSAPMQLFMGYVECYSILAVFMLLFIACIVGYYLNRLPIWAPGIAFGLALMFHADALFLAPVLIAPLVWPASGSSRSLLRRLILLAIPIVGAVGVAAIIFRVQGYSWGAFRYDFLVWRPDNQLFMPLTGEHGFLSWQHWKDILNLLLLLAPVPVVMLVSVFALKPWAKGSPERAQKTVRNGETPLATDRARDPDARTITILLCADLWLLAFMSTIHMKQGIARDWDLFAAHVPLLVLTAWFAWTRFVRGRVREELVGATVSTALFLSLPWFWLNAGEARSLHWFRDVTPGFPAYQKAYAHEELGNYYRDKDDVSDALREYRTSADAFPGHARFRAALGSLQYSEGMHEEALKTFREALAVDSTQRVALELIARIYDEREDYDTTLLYARRLARAGQERPLAALFHADAAENLGLVDEALAGYKRALLGDPSNTELMYRIGRLYVRKGDFSDAEETFASVLSRRPDSVPARTGLATAIWEPIRRNRQTWNTPATQARLQTVDAILSKLITDGKSDAETMAWREEVRRVRRVGAKP